MRMDYLNILNNVENIFWLYSKVLSAKKKFDGEKKVL